MDKNHCLERLINIKNSIGWTNTESILMGHYVVGTSSEGADAYSPLLLFKCLLLQKWFHIDSDPELENQINDRISFKKFIGISFSDVSPDHSTFSRFRSRLSKEAMDQINTEILRQFENQGLTINEGIAVDARLVKSASHPVGNDQIKKLKEKKILLKVSSIKMANRSSSQEIWNQIGQLRATSLITALKSMPL